MEVSSFCTQGERESVQMAGKKTEDGNETKEINPLFITRLNFQPVPFAVGCVRGEREQPEPLVSSPLPQRATQLPGFCVPVYQTPPVFTALQQRQHYVFLRRLCA